MGCPWSITSKIANRHYEDAHASLDAMEARHRRCKKASKLSQFYAGSLETVQQEVEDDLRKPKADYVA